MWDCRIREAESPEVFRSAIHSSIEPVDAVQPGPPESREDVDAQRRLVAGVGLRLQVDPRREPVPSPVREQRCRQAGVDPVAPLFAADYGLVSR